MNSACVQVPVGTLTKPLICVGVMIELEAKEEKTFFHVFTTSEILCSLQNKSRDLPMN